MSNVRSVQDLYAAFGRGDIPSVLGAFDPKIAWRQAENHPYQLDGTAWIGPNAVLESLFMRIAADWDGFTVTPEQFHDAGATVVVEGRYTGKHKSTRKSLDAQFCHVWRFQSGKIASFQQFVDTAQLHDVMGTR